MVRQPVIDYYETALGNLSSALTACGSVLLQLVVHTRPVRVSRPRPSMSIAPPVVIPVRVKIGNRTVVRTVTTVTIIKSLTRANVCCETPCTATVPITKAVLTTVLITPEHIRFAGLLRKLMLTFVLGLITRLKLLKTTRSLRLGPSSNTGSLVLRTRRRFRVRFSLLRLKCQSGRRRTVGLWRLSGVELSLWLWAGSRLKVARSGIDRLRCPRRSQGPWLGRWCQTLRERNIMRVFRYRGLRLDPR